MRTLSLAVLSFFFFFLSPAFSAGQGYTIPLGDSPSLGPENAPVTIVEFIDFQ